MHFKDIERPWIDDEDIIITMGSHYHKIKCHRKNGFRLIDLITRVCEMNTHYHSDPNLNDDNLTLDENQIDWNIKFTEELHNRNDYVIEYLEYDPSTKLLTAEITN